MLPIVNEPDNSVWTTSQQYNTFTTVRAYKNVQQQYHIGTAITNIPNSDFKNVVSNWKKTLAYLLVLPGSRARIVRCGGCYDPQLVKRSSEWVSRHPDFTYTHAIFSAILIIQPLSITCASTAGRNIVFPKYSLSSCFLTVLICIWMLVKWN